jgi:hypothetical protein
MVLTYHLNGDEEKLYQGTVLRYWWNVVPNVVRSLTKNDECISFTNAIKNNKNAN